MMGDRKIMDPPKATSEATHRSMISNRSKNTTPEIIFRRALIDANLGGYRLHLKSVPGNPDIVYLSKRVVIFINGCFWHRCPICKLRLPKQHQEFWRRKFIANINRDKKNVSILKEEGWTIFIVWECEIKSKQLLSQQIQIIKNHLRKIVDTI